MTPFRTNNHGNTECCRIKQKGGGMARCFCGMRCFAGLLLLLATGCGATIQQVREPIKSPDLVKMHCDLMATPRVERQR
jgi:hypothetical protein